MNIDKVNKIITINKEDISSKYIGNIARLNEKPFWDKNGKYIGIVNRKDGYANFIIIDTLENLKEYKLEINVKHVIMYNDDTFELYESNTYLIKNIYNIYQINFGCLNPEKSVEKLINNLELKNIKMAEIGIRYCSTALYNVQNINQIISYDLYEIEHMFCENARKIFKNDNHIHVFEGPANETLKNVDKNIIYDFIFYDCTHHYESDKIIVEEMKKHINNKTVVCFHDYNISEVRKLVHEFADLKLCRVYAIDKHNIVKIFDDNVD